MKRCRFLALVSLAATGRLATHGGPGLHDQDSRVGTQAVDQLLLARAAIRPTHDDQLRREPCRRFSDDVLQRDILHTREYFHERRSPAARLRRTFSSSSPRSTGFTT